MLKKAPTEAGGDLYRHGVADDAHDTAPDTRELVVDWETLDHRGLSYGEVANTSIEFA